MPRRVENILLQESNADAIHENYQVMTFQFLKYLFQIITVKVYH